SKRIKVLAIDDQPIILELLTAMCRSLDYDIQTTQSGSEGVMYAENKKFDIIFTDLAMPGISGLEVSSRIRKFRPYTPIILLTGWEAKLDSEQLSKSGITNVLYKPFRIEQLTDMIKSSVVSNSLS
ncbi:MAG: hybrid sensor histidine kinase/response regulator, partial [Candidatus Zixiibacteriota bacterium]